MSDESIAITISEIRPTEINEAALRESASFDYSIIWIPAVVLLALAVCSGLIYKWYRRKQANAKANDPQDLFRELCAAHGLGYGHRRALLRLAEIRKTSNPCLVVFDAALWPEENDPLINRSLQNKLTALRRNLFQSCTSGSPESTKGC